MNASMCASRRNARLLSAAVMSALILVFLIAPSGALGVDVAGRRIRAATVLGRAGPLRGRAAPRHRHLHRARACRGCAGGRHCLVRRLRAGRRPRGHDHHRRWLCRDVAPTRGDDRRSRQHGRGGRGGRCRRRECGRRHVAAPRPPRDSRGLRPGRIRRPARAAACTPACTPASSVPGAAGGRTGSSRHRRDSVTATCAAGPENVRSAEAEPLPAPATEPVVERPAVERPAVVQPVLVRPTAVVRPTAIVRPTAVKRTYEEARPRAASHARPRPVATRDRCPFVAEASVRAKPGDPSGGSCTQRRGPGHRHASADRVEGEQGKRSSSAGGRHSARRGTSAGEPHPADRAAAYAHSGSLDPRAHRPGARRRCRAAGAAQACAYHGWRSATT